MFVFSREQVTVEICGIKIGGQPGQNPTAMIGSMFYDGHGVIEDPTKGKIDREEALSQIRVAEALSDKYGLPLIIDIVGTTKEAMERYIGFVADATSSPFLLDGATAEVRVAALQLVSENGLSERSIFNSINQDTRDFEIQALLRSKVRSAIVFAYNLRDPTIEGRLSLLRGAEGTNLLRKAEQANVERIMIDMFVLDGPDMGPAAKAIFLEKTEFGYPAGCGPGNTMDQWNNAGIDQVSRTIFRCAASAFPVALGADFILFGAIQRAKYAFPACALYNGYTAYTARRYGVHPSKTHPLYKIF